MAPNSKCFSRNPLPPPPPPPSLELEKDFLPAGKENLCLDLRETPAYGGDDDHRFLFFGRRHRGSENTWAISLFIVIHFVAFVNNCPEKFAGDCALRPLGRFSFQHLAENPLLGPSSSTIVSLFL